METRDITIKFKAGEIKGVFLNSALDSIYLKLFQNAKRTARRHPLDVEHGVKMIVFGCFLLEAKVNAELRYVLGGISEQELFNTALWKTLRKRNILEKIEIISSLATNAQQERISLLLPGIRNVFDLRNRLAHFKDEPQQHAKVSTPVAVLDFIKNLPIPDLNKKLMWSESKCHAAFISNAYKWLHNFHHSYCKRKNIKETSEQLFAGEIPIEPLYRNG